MLLSHFRLVLLLTILVSNLSTASDVSNVSQFAEKLVFTRVEHKDQYEIAFRVLHPYLYLDTENSISAYSKIMPYLRNYKYEMLQPSKDYDSVIEWIKIGLILGTYDIKSVETGEFDTGVKLLKFPSKNIKCLKSIPATLNIVERYNAFLNCDYSFFGFIFGVKSYPYLGSDIDLDKFEKFKKAGVKDRKPGFVLDLH